MAALITTLVLMLAPYARAQEMPKPSPEMARLDFFEGNWTCQGKVNDSPMGPGGAMTATAQVRDDLGGFWQAGTIKGTIAKMPAFEGRFYETYDPAAKHFVMFWVDNMGGWSRSTSPGWQGDNIAYEGESHMPGQKPMKTRDMFARSGAASMKHTWEMQIDGKWVQVGEENCTKK
jgi:hypothetical protein